MVLIKRGDGIIRVKIFDFEHELELEREINYFIERVKVIDIKYQVSAFSSNGEQIFCFSALIIYEDA